VIELPKIPRLPKHPCGHEISAQDARALIEEVSQREWGIGWQDFRRRWNHSEFTEEERKQIRPLARLLAFAVQGLPPGHNPDRDGPVET
jgi:hypothetical protein